MRLYGHVLNDEEKKKIHEKSIRILEEVGVEFPSERALTLLESKGAKIDWDKQIAFISREMVKEALDTAPKEFVLGARNSAYDLKMPTQETYYNLDGGGPYVYDYATGKRRNSTSQDLINAARVFNEVELGNLIWPCVSAGEVEAAAQGIVEEGLLFKHYEKHLQNERLDPKEVEFTIHMLKAILGNDIEKIKERKIYSVCYCTVPPLSHDKLMMEATMDLSKYDIPILAFPMPASGSTGPASLYSNIALCNAETLSIYVLFQAESPGVPIIYGAAPGATNRRSGLFLEGAAEAAIQFVALQEMGVYYGFPTMIAGCLSDAKEPGTQTIIEKMATSLPLVMAGTNVIQGIGLFESSMTLYLEQILVDEEIIQMNKRLKESVRVTDDFDFFEDIKQVGPGGHFLKQKSTRATFRSDEYYTPSLMDRESYEDWLSGGSPNMYDKAHKRVEEILATEPKNPLPTNVEKEIDEIMKEAIRVLE